MEEYIDIELAKALWSITMSVIQIWMAYMLYKLTKERNER